MQLTEEEERILASIPDCPPRKKPLPLPRPILVADRKLNLEGQRERVVKEVKELATAERNAPRPNDPGRFYYRRLYEAVAYAEYWAKQLCTGQYDLFEKDRV
jgi:hypothetical protein